MRTGPLFRWECGSNLLNASGQFVPGSNPTFGGNPVELNSTLSSWTWQPICLLPATTAVGLKVEVDDLVGSIFDVTDPCAGGPTVSFRTAAESHKAFNFNVGTGDIVPYPDNSSLNEGFILDTTLQSSECPCGGGKIGICISVYVSKFIAAPSGDPIWQLKAPLGRDATYDYEHLLCDSYLLPLNLLSSPYTGRSWPVRLRRPLVIGRGEALHITISYDSGSSHLLEGASAFYMARFRARIRAPFGS